jgi:hypothetical protein
MSQTKRTLISILAECHECAPFGPFYGLLVLSLFISALIVLATDGTLLSSLIVDYHLLKRWLYNQFWARMDGERR